MLSDPSITLVLVEQRLGELRRAAELHRLRGPSTRRASP
ncbi:hypothetical protein CLV35_0660 [Motilibacter peucedani]|uniref:Uncharacterized protein n=1 Tax=Motilibacter peucedani TaxID=598650 RepID=A0A420XTZ9_9ACTN|nr:hypothetical protein CLV35_0660 [Motilibacter peucedani]